MCYKAFIPGLCPLESSSTSLPPKCDNQMYLQTASLEWEVTKQTSSQSRNTGVEVKSKDLIPILPLTKCITLSNLFNLCASLYLDVKWNPPYRAIVNFFFFLHANFFKWYLVHS
jgi:hypothetical protein